MTDHEEAINNDYNEIARCYEIDPAGFFIVNEDREQYKMAFKTYKQLLSLALTQINLCGIKEL